MLEIKSLLKLMFEKNASDLHLTAGLCPHLRIDENLAPTHYEPLSNDEIKRLVYSMLSKKQVDIFEREMELDMSFGVEELGRFRINVYLQKGNISCAIRALPFNIRNFDELGLPGAIMTDLCSKPKGLVLITGATGSGKSTTLAAMVDYINAQRPCHIITVEDPIEYLYTKKRAIIDQREIGQDSTSFSQALKHVLRQDPNVILIGEMRDLETIEAALIIAETGHLVFSTLHTSDSAQAVNRVVDVFPARQQQQIKVQLSFVLLSVISQQLIPRASGIGRALATEILIATPAVKNLIRESKVAQIYSVLQTSQKEGMRTMNQSLAELCMNNKIRYEDALARSLDPDDLKRFFKA